MRSRTEASNLKNDSKDFFRKSDYARRAPEYRPSLTHFSNTSFSDFVRLNILGVPDGCDVTLTPTAAISGDRHLSSQNRVHSTPTSPSTPNAINDNRSKASVDATSRDKSPGNQGRDDLVVFDIEPAEAPLLRKRNKKVSRKIRKPAQLCKQRLADGIAKVTPPEGWWDKKGIGNDTTARGPNWSHGTELGDKLITSPIKQCISGIGGVYEFTMMEINPLTIAQFREDADRYRKKQIGSECDDDVSDEFIDNLARKFWRRLGPTMEPCRYGADMDGSLFDGAEACGWNIDKLDSCLQLLRVDAADGDQDDVTSLPGVTSAYLYVGMWASVFAAHNEDMNLLAINYLHAGAPKYWYAISPEDTQRFESLATSHFGSAASMCSEFLRHKRCLLSPAFLKKAGIKYTTQIQRPGDAIITFPGVYHFGFNTGFNIAESTNFGVPEWMSIGRTARICMCHPHSVRIDMNRLEDLLDEYEEAARENPGITYTDWAKNEAKRRKQKSNDTGSSESPKNICYKKGVVVEVVALASSRSSNSPENTKNKGRSSPRKRKNEVWRLALRVKPSVFTRNTQVLCMLPGRDYDSDEKSDVFFSGIIKDVNDGHVRIHFPGSAKKEDVWLPIKSQNLFLDGGPEASPKKKK